MSVVNRILKDAVIGPSAENLFRIARALNLPPIDVFRLAGADALETRADLETFLRSEYGLPDNAINQINAIISRHARKGDAS